MPISHRMILRYTSGSLSQGIAPDWFEKHITAEESNWDLSLRKGGATEIEKFGQDGDTLTIYRTTDGYYVEYFDINEPTAHIFIDDIADYLRFRIDWIKPLVELIGFSDAQQIASTKK
jgi:hypothetical protein